MISSRLSLATFLLAVSLIAVGASCGSGAAGGGGGGGSDNPDAGQDGGNGNPTGCGDAIVQRGEACDDGNTISRDGCSADCLTIEGGYACVDPGRPCVRPHVCGNGLFEVSEECDDRNTRPGDGCSATCTLEGGWTCPVPGIRCTAARCGDGVIAGIEECDDGNPDSADGCSASCKVETGHACDAAGAPCRTTTCGDGLAEGTEECDDQNNNLGDGCDPLCHREPLCANGVCTAVCGDGVIQSTEACDDGNLRDDDGCSATCVVENGFTCSPVAAAEPTSEAVSVVYRDFRGFDLTGGHPDFEHYNGSDRAIVASTLGNDGKPVYAGNPTTPTTTGAANFASWYRDAAGINMTYAETLTLTRTAAATYVFDNSAFFPLDGRGFVGAGTEPARNNGHNFSFTSELRYWFEYKGGEVLTFRGDDDVWVFINRKLAVNLGGVHSAETGTITLDSMAATNLGLIMNGTYEVVVLQAERHTTASSYKLTLKGFNAAQSNCSYLCGDAITTPYEVCDDGVNDGSYGSCTANCLGFGPRCGDNVVQADHDEQCDDGFNAGGYDRCQPRCQLGPRCGDGIVQPAYEDCDTNGVDTVDCVACHNVIE
jgi:fibro-slime domain-containing protein